MSFGLHMTKKKNNPVHVAPDCAESGEGCNHFGSYVCSIFLHFCPRLFLGLEHMTYWSQGNSFTAAPDSPSKGRPYRCLEPPASKTWSHNSSQWPSY
jgi:hypothetical protein